jgi:hypothetical protein
VHFAYGLLAYEANYEYLIHEAIYLTHEANYLIHETNYLTHEANYLTHEVNAIIFQPNLTPGMINSNFFSLFRRQNETSAENGFVSSGLQK